jgi:hypothetical protein
MACPNDAFEPNEAEASAHDLGALTDCDDTGGTLQGVLDGVSDADWFRYDAADTVSCKVDPTRTVVSQGPIRVCKFFECTSPGPSVQVTCLDGSLDDVSPQGRSGCCSDHGFSTKLDCGNGFGGDDSATVYVRVDTSKPGVCLAYGLAYHF